MLADEFCGHVKQALVGMEHKDETSAKLRRSRLDPADDGITVFDRKRKSAPHERSAHADELALRHTAGKHQRLGTAAKRPI
jgi:hypothetical protein